MEYSIEELLSTEMLVVIGPDPSWLKQRRLELAALRAIAVAAQALCENGKVGRGADARWGALIDALDELTKSRGKEGESVWVREGSE